MIINQSATKLGLIQSTAFSDGSVDDFGSGL